MTYNEIIDTCLKDERHVRECPYLRLVHADRPLWVRLGDPVERLALVISLGSDTYHPHDIVRLDPTLEHISEVVERPFSGTTTFTWPVIQNHAELGQRTTDVAISLGVITREDIDSPHGARDLTGERRGSHVLHDLAEVRLRHHGYLLHSHWKGATLYSQPG